MKRALVIFVLPMVLAACIKAGPDYSQPQVGDGAPDTFANVRIEETTQPATLPDSSRDPWWKAFSNPELDALVEKALEHNPDIKIASARVLEYQALLAQANAGKYPSVNLSGEGSWSEASVSSSTPVFTAKGLEFQTRQRSVHSTGLSLAAAASYELDLWGRIARSNEAARADLLAIEENAQTVARTVVAETVSTFLEMENYRRRIQITQQSIKDFKRNLDFVRMRYEGGIASVLDLRQARRLLAQAESLLPPLRRDLEARAASLAVLVGEYPDLELPGEIPDDYFEDLPRVPAGLPSQLLMRRPDVREAEARLQAANARIGVAKATRFPTIKLTGSMGTSSDELEDLFSPESRFWNLAAGLLAPVYDAGKLKAGEEAALARFAQMEASYAKTVLTAFAEVESALSAQEEQREYRRLLVKLVEEAQATRQVAESRYEQGLSSYLAVLDAQQALYTAQQSLVISELAIYLNRVALHRALGGGWPELNLNPTGHESTEDEQPENE